MQERRSTRRRPVALKVIFQQPELPPLRGSTRDVALDGAFVRAPIADVVAGDPLVLDLPLPYHGHTEWYRIEGRVVRVTEDGIGLRFTGFDNRVYTGLIEVVYGGRQPRLA